MTNLFAGDHQFVDAHSAGVAGLAAMSATGRLIQGLIAQRFAREIGGQVVQDGLVGLPALRTQPPDQTLRHHRLDRAGHQKRLDPHVHQPRVSASGIVRVQGTEDQMAGQRRLDGVLGGLQVADFTDQHYVRVVTQDAPQRMRERQADPGMNLNLVDPLQLILDRILGGNDLDVRAVDLDQRTVQRGRLSRTGRPGDQDDAVRQFDQLTVDLVRRYVHPERLQLENHRTLVQDTQHNAFAVNHRDHRDAHVHLATAHFQLDPPVLRQAFFGDVQPSHDLQTADDRRFETMDLRRYRLRLQHAVDPVADHQPRGLRFDMHVAGPRLDRFQQDLVHQPDDRRLLGHLGQFRAVQVEILQQLDAVVQFRLGDQALDRLAAYSQMLLDQLGDFDPRSQNRDHGQARDRTHLVDRIQIERIAGRHHNRAVVAADREQRLTVDQFLRKILENLPEAGFLDRRQVDEIQTHGIADGPQGVFFVHKTHLNDRIQQRFAATLARKIQLALVQTSAS